MTRFLLFQVLMVMGLTAGIVGCGEKARPNGPTVIWEGRVTIQGKDLPENLKEAYIQVRPANARKMGQASPTQAVIQKGKYRLEQVPRGEVTVYFVLKEATGRKIREREGLEYDETRTLVPKSRQRGISLQATEDNREQNFDL
ncbi:MAG: hypothetical protein Q4D62_03345 [Planctomycetia bacterium]|nr:hypothetical protein [Planctomycetia bacterium]